MPAAIRAMQDRDWPMVRAIYQESNGTATFETRVPVWASWDESHLDVCRFVANPGQRHLKPVCRFGKHESHHSPTKHNFGLGSAQPGLKAAGIRGGS